jgi:cytochrome c-type biogenesis protein CcmE
MENKGILIYLVLLTIAIIIVLIFMAVNTSKNHTEVTEQITEIKSKIGAVVRAFNINAIQDHNVNMQQQDEIESIKEKII